MLRISALYANEEGAHFDFSYYRDKHFPMVLNLLKPFGAIRFEVDRGLPLGNGAPPEFIAIGHLFIESRDELNKGMAIHGAAILGDIKNYTNLTPRVQTSEVW
ncbi:MAG: EthD family reductase [Burkholderiales bacterium]|nr:EthD family reductase [Burkholderiales bacterium]